MIKDEVGIEREYFLLDEKSNIVEPKLFGFPIDEYGFLVEIRTQPHTKASSLLDELNRLIDAHKTQAERLGLKLHLAHRMRLNPLFVKQLHKAYAWDYLKDITANIHSGTDCSHATGIQGFWGTAGLHLHFSKKRIIKHCSNFPTISRIQLPIRKIVLAMDVKFSDEILKSNRIEGEYEIKPYGFEYRSLPASIDIKPVVDFAFYLLNRSE